MCFGSFVPFYVFWQFCAVPYKDQSTAQLIEN